MKKYLLSFTLTFLIIFYSFVPQVVFANPYIPVVEATPEILANAKYLTPLLAPFAPEIALVTCVAISAGVIYENREQLITMGGGLLLDLKSAGYVIGRSTTNALSLTAEGLDFLTRRIGEIAFSHTQSIPIGNNLTGMGMLGINNVYIPVGVTWGILDKLGNISMQSSVTTFPTHVLVIPDGAYVKFQDQPIGINYISQPTYIPVTSTFRINGGDGTGSICINPTYPSQVFEGDIIGSGIGAISRPLTIPYPSGNSICIPNDLTLDGDITSDWTSDLVGTADWTAAFPQPTEPPNEDLEPDYPTPEDDPTLDDYNNIINVPTNDNNYDGVADDGSGIIQNDNIINKMNDKSNLTRFAKTWEQINNMNTAQTAPPKIQIDLNKMFIAFTSKFGAPKSPFHAEPYIFFDFNSLNTYKFGDISLIEYFRGLIGSGFILTTFLYVWRKLTSREVSA